MNLRTIFNKLALESNLVLRITQTRQLSSVYDHTIYSKSTASSKSSTKDGSYFLLKQEKNLKNELVNLKLGSESFFPVLQELKFSKIIPKNPCLIDKKIIDPELYEKVNIEAPQKVNILNDLNLPADIFQKKIDPIHNNIAKEASFMIKIRKRKMKIHKRKKFYKKWKFLIAKRIQKKEMKKEKLFQGKLKAILALTENFSAERHIRNKLMFANWKPPITRVKGILAPRWVIKEHLAEKKYKKIVSSRMEACIKEKQY